MPVGVGFFVALAVEHLLDGHLLAEQHGEEAFEDIEIGFVAEELFDRPVKSDELLWHVAKIWLMCCLLTLCLVGLFAGMIDGTKFFFCMGKEGSSAPEFIGNVLVCGRPYPVCIDLVLLATGNCVRDGRGADLGGSPRWWLGGEVYGGRNGGRRRMNFLSAERRTEASSEPRTRPTVSCAFC